MKLFELTGFGRIPVYLNYLKDVGMLRDEDLVSANRGRYLLIACDKNTKKKNTKYFDTHADAVNAAPKGQQKHWLIFDTEVDRVLDIPEWWDTSQHLATTHHAQQ